MVVEPLVQTVVEAIDLPSEDIANILPPAQQNDSLRTQCAETIGVTLN
ncbi:MAG: hypothetical protein ACOYD7_06860 [Raoultibacter sp.]